MADWYLLYNKDYKRISNLKKAEEILLKVLNLDNSDNFTNIEYVYSRLINICEKL